MITINVSAEESDVRIDREVDVFSGSTSVALTTPSGRFLINIRAMDTGLSVGVHPAGADLGDDGLEPVASLWVTDQDMLDIYEEHK